MALRLKSGERVEHRSIYKRKPRQSLKNRWMSLKLSMAGVTSFCER